MAKLNDDDAVVWNDLQLWPQNEDVTCMGCQLRHRESICLYIIRKNVAYVNSGEDEEVTMRYPFCRYVCLKMLLFQAFGK